jgi:hypothetical protein
MDAPTSDLQYLFEFQMQKRNEIFFNVKNLKL